jgi:hypothetical protein
MGYHKIKIEKGILGEHTKIIEEFTEWQDAFGQSNPIMELVELSDLLGAIEAYTKERHNIDMVDLLKMTRATQDAFKDGSRK